MTSKTSSNVTIFLKNVYYYLKLKGVTEIMHPFKILKWLETTMIMTKDSPLGKFIDKIYTIGYYTGFYSSLSDKI